MPKLNAPQEAEIEVSVFGPGKGECVVIHVGHGEWLIVDCCRLRKSASPIGLDYLRGLGVDPASQVKLIVATHWHDDHFAGLAELVDVCQSARFVCSAALSNREFLTLLATVGESKLLDDSGVDELSKVMESLTSRGVERRIKLPENLI